MKTAVLLLAMMVLGLLLGSTAAHLTDPDRSTSSLAVGDCLTGTPDEWPADVAEVSCTSRSADWEVLGHWRLTDTELPDMSRLEGECPGRLFSPSSTSWERGDRTVMCLHSV